MAIDQTKLQALLGRAVVDIGANFHAALVVTGDKARRRDAIRSRLRGPGLTDGETATGDLPSPRLRADRVIDP